MKFHIFASFLHPLGVLYSNLRTRKVAGLREGLIAQLVEHCTGIAEVMGLNPVQS